MSERIERAAGGFVVRVRDGERQVLLIDDAYDHVTFPKGHVEKGETWEDAAIREVLEETAIEARILEPLGRLEYPIVREGNRVRKQVRLFLMEEIDEQDNPEYQAEEIRGAYFLPFEEAKRTHEAKGYGNWSFLFEKAASILALRDFGFEEKVRRQVADEAGALFDERWKSAAPLVDDLAQAVRGELSTMEPTWVLPTEVKSASVLPKGVYDIREAIRDAVEHTLLKPEASELSVDKLCLEALEHRFKAVCVNPQHIGTVASHLQGSSTIPCVVVGFPLGATTVQSIAMETRSVVGMGAREVDMVIPIGSMREDDIWSVFDRVKAVCDTAHQTPGVAVKVILEAHFLSFAQVAMASLVSLCAGADFIKTSTGFAPSGALLADVALMHMLSGDAEVKAAGGIRTQAAAREFLRYGASRLGTSSGATLVR